MHIRTDRYVLTLAALGGLAAAEKGAAEVYGCIWQSTPPIKPYTIDWLPGSTSDRCMRLTGSAASMTVSKAGITCQTLGKVAVDSSYLCYFKQSWWGLSYTAKNIAYSGSTNSQWTTGPSNSDITLKNQSPGTSVCSSPSHCSGPSIEWPNDSNAELYVVFNPIAVGDPGKPNKPDDLAMSQFGLNDWEGGDLNVQEAELRI
ncbi:hypothetical protein F4859DRAFT_484830 [Xylaria cf. heliscus]|nr:hypothetical protein F4859DRAFT_484830 [Xylaria cf. heliscus]